MKTALSALLIIVSTLLILACASAQVPAAPQLTEQRIFSDLGIALERSAVCAEHNTALQAYAGRLQIENDELKRELARLKAQKESN